MPGTTGVRVVVEGARVKVEARVVGEESRNLVHSCAGGDDGRSFGSGNGSGCWSSPESALAFSEFGVGIELTGKRCTSEEGGRRRSALCGAAPVAEDRKLLRATMK